MASVLLPLLSTLQLSFPTKVNAVTTVYWSFERFCGTHRLCPPNFANRMQNFWITVGVILKTGPAFSIYHLWPLNAGTCTSFLFFPSFTPLLLFLFCLLFVLLFFLDWQIGTWYSNNTLVMNSTSLDLNASETLANKTLVVTTILVKKNNLLLDCMKYHW